MNIPEKIEGALAVLYSKIPTAVLSVRLWSWYITRKCILYFTVYYTLDTVLGHRRRVLGRSPLRDLDLSKRDWCLKSIDRILDEETRAALEVTGHKSNVAIEDLAEQHNTAHNAHSYAEVPYRPILRPLPDEDPLPLDGKEQPPGFSSFVRAMKIFGNFDTQECIPIWKATIKKELQPKEILFNVGDPDDCFYIIMTGAISIYYDDDDFGIIKLKTVQPDECILSLLSALSQVTAFTAKPKPVKAVAEKTSLVFKVSFSGVWESFKNRPHLFNAFMLRAMRNLRQLYFEGLEQVARLSRHTLAPHMMKSTYQDYTVNTNDPVEMKALEAEVKSCLLKYLPLTPEDLKCCRFGELAAGTTLINVGRWPKNMVYIVRGEIVAYIERMVNRMEPDKESKNGKRYSKIIVEDQPAFYLGKGSLACTWGLITNCRNQYTLKVAPGTRAVIAEVPGTIVKRIWAESPQSMLPFIHNLNARFSNFCRALDFCVDWIHVPPGKIIFKKGDVSRPTYMMLSGRVRYKISGTHILVNRVHMEVRSKFGVYEAGDWFGFIETLVKAKAMQKTVVADKYCEIAALPREVINLMCNKFPDRIIASLVDYLAYRVHREYRYDMPFIKQVGDDIVTLPRLDDTGKRNTVVIAVFPVSNDIPGELYCQDFIKHYPCSYRCKYLNIYHFEDSVGNIKERMNSCELISWLLQFQDDQEYNLLVLLGTPNGVNLWNTIIARQADFIQTLVSTRSVCTQYLVEELVEREGWKAVKDFVILHPAKHTPHNNPGWIPQLSAPHPKASRRWLNGRQWLDTHHHVRFPESAFSFIKTLNAKDMEEYDKYRRARPDKHGDIARLGRWVSNNMIGICLGGGGAKGAAHIGFFHYLQQTDIPVDYLCGVSIGSFVAGLFAIYQDTNTIESKLKTLFSELKHPSKYLQDLTIPYTSVFRGRSFDEFVRNSFGNAHIEDFWVPYFCVTTDLTGTHSRIHRSGRGWFYVRASMTLTMIFPPLVCPTDGHLIMDGGYSDILPGHHLRAVGVRFILAVDIGDQNGIPLFNIGYEYSGIQCILQNIFLQTSSVPSVPSRFSFWEQLNYIAARKYIALLKRADRKVIYIRPMVEFYNGKDFDKFDEIKMMGFYTTRKRFHGVGPGLPIELVWNILEGYDPRREMEENNRIKRETAKKLYDETEVKTRRMYDPDSEISDDDDHEWIPKPPKFDDVD